MAETKGTLTSRSVVQLTRNTYAVQVPKRPREGGKNESVPADQHHAPLSEAPKLNESR
jgi:hypothetical protein